MMSWSDPPDQVRSRLCHNQDSAEQPIFGLVVADSECLPGWKITEMILSGSI